MKSNDKDSLRNSSVNPGLAPDGAEKLSGSTPSDKKRKKRSLIWRVAKWCAVLLMILIAAVIGLTATGVWLLTPEKLTPLVEKYGSEYITGEIKADRIELTFWNSFPRLTVEAEGVEVISHAFDSLSPAEKALLPVYADSLVKIGKLKGAINIPMAARGKFQLYDIEIHHVSANIVQYSPTLANYDIVPASEEKEESRLLPDLSINRFRIFGDSPFRYYSLPDSTDVTIRLLQTSLTDQSSAYSLKIDGIGTAELASHKWFEGIRFGVNGRVDWSPKKPDLLGVEDMDVNLGNAVLRLNALLDFTGMMTLNKFNLTASSLKIEDVADIIPPLYAGELRKIQTDLAIDLDLELQGPFRPKADEWPTVNLRLDIPAGSLKYDRLALNTVRGRIEAMLNGKDPDASWVKVEDMTLVGQSIGLNIRGMLSTPLTDPTIEVALKGGADFSRLPKPLIERLPLTFRGRLNGDTEIKLRESYLKRKEFHRIKAAGSLDLYDFDMAMKDSTLRMYTDHVNFRFGTSTNVKLATDVTADSLLTARLTIDSTAVEADGIWFSGRRLSVGVGMKNVATTGDTTKINPIGFNIKGERITMKSPADSMTVRLRGANIRGGLTRYEGGERRPLLRLGLDAGLILYRDNYNRALLRNGTATFTAHTKQRPTMSRRVGLAYDSLLNVYPDLRRDSILSMARREVRAQRFKPGDTLRIRHQGPRKGHENDVDLMVDGSIRSLLQWWEASGTLKAEKGGLFTSYFPLRNSMSDLDMRLTTDSVVIKDTRLRLGQSDLLVNGSITNITRAISSRVGNTLNMEFDIRSDTLNVNQIAQAIFAGSAFRDKVAKGAEVKIKDTDDEAELQKSIEANADINDKLAFIVPSNINASLSLTAKNVLYADIWAQRLRGDISIAGGRVNLHRFSGFTDLGSIDLTALYTAPNMDELSFGGGMVIRNLDLKRFLHMLPEIDSIMPLLRDVEGIVTADIAMTTRLDSLMDIKFHTLNLAMKLHGDSLVLLDTETFRTASKWLRFKHKDHNMIDSMSVEMAIHDSRLDLYPFVFNFDRYKLGVSGGNTFDGDYDYHVAVLKSPLPFKFGINIKGHDHKLRIRLGKARFNENAIASSRGLTDTLRINLLNEIESVFKFGVSNGKRKELILTQPKITAQEFSEGDQFSRADSLLMIKEGVIQATPGYLEAIEEEKKALEAKEKKKKRKRFLGIF